MRILFPGQAFTEEKQELETKYKVQLAKLEAELEMDPTKRKLEVN